MVAAAGGGGAWESTSIRDGQNGSGLYVKGLSIYGYHALTTVGSGTQVSGAAFGIGRNGGAGNASCATGGSGGGYYTGHNPSTGQGPGGTSFISGHPGCIAITSSTDRTAKNTQYSAITDSYHYSNLYFTETKMIDGSGYKWTTSRGSREQMPNPAGGLYNSGVGHTGNGYARITNINN